MSEKTARKPAESPLTSLPLASHGSGALRGRLAAPGDRAISHGALMLSALAVGRSRIEGLLETDDVMTSVAALRQLGVRIERGDMAWHVHGLGVGGLLRSEQALDLGNSGSAAYLLLGMLAPLDFSTHLTGAPAQTRRGMQNLLEGLIPLGASVSQPSDAHLLLRGARIPLPLHLTMAAPSEPIKSALLLAAAQIAGTSTIIEPTPTGDHTEKLLADFGADISVAHDEAGGATITLTGLTELRPRDLVVPGDPSAAAFPLVAALVVPGSELVIENVLVNPTRTGLIDTLLEMGGDIQFLNQHEVAGEHIADLLVRSSRLRGLAVTARHAATMLDDIPALAVAAAFAQGETVIEGLADLREQECDRLAALAAGLAANKVTVREGDASLVIGGAGKVEGGGMVISQGDDRIAMSFLVMGLASQKPVTIDDAGAIAASFPGFLNAMTAIGGRFDPVEGRQT